MFSDVIVHVIMMQSFSKLNNIKLLCLELNSFPSISIIMLNYMFVFTNQIWSMLSTRTIKRIKVHVFKHEKHNRSSSPRDAQYESRHTFVVNDFKSFLNDYRNSMMVLFLLTEKLTIYTTKININGMDV